MHRVYTAHHEQTEVHQVAVAPATIALEFVEQVRRQLFVTARQVVGDPHAPAGTAHQRGFDEVVGEDRPGERAGAGQRRQRAVVDERLYANDRVVAPVVRFTQLPEVEPGGEQRAVDPRGELLQPRIERVHARRLGRGLDDAGIGVGLHQSDQAGQTFATHHAVGVQHHHIAVAAAPATTEVVDVAALALHPATAATVEDVTEAIHRTAQLDPGLLLGNTGVRVVAVAEHENVEMLEFTGCLERLVSRAQAGEHTRHVLVGNRHHQRRTRLGRYRFGAGAAGRDAVTVLAAQQLEEAHQRSPEAHRDPAEQQCEEQQDAGLHHIGKDLPSRLGQRLDEHFLHVDQEPALVRQHRLHLPGGKGGLAEHQQQQRCAAQGRDPAPARLVKRLRTGLEVTPRRRATQNPAPATAQDIGMPGLRHHARAHDRRGRLHIGAPLVILGDHAGAVEQIAPAQPQSRNHRIEQTPRRAALRAGLGRQFIMQREQAALLGRLPVSGRVLGFVQRQAVAIALRQAIHCMLLIHGEESGRSRFRKGSCRHRPAPHASRPGAPGRAPSRAASGASPW